MIDSIAFDNECYIREQTRCILERVERFNHKLYLEFGGKLLYDYHAARVLPGYDPNVKMRLLQRLKDQADILLCIYAGDIERKKIRADFGITYDTDAMKLIDDLKPWGIDVLGVVITRFDSQPAAMLFKNKLERRGIKVYTHRFTKGYPTDVDTIVSDDGYGANEIHCDRQAPGHRNRSGTGQRQAGDLPFPVVPRLPPWPKIGLCQVRDLPDLEHPLEASCQHSLRGSHGGYQGFQPASIPSTSRPMDRPRSIITGMWRSFPYCAESWRRSPVGNHSTNPRQTWA